MEHAQIILGYLCEKTVLDFTPEDTIEKYFDGKIHYYHARQALQFLAGQKHIVYSRIGGAWKATEKGRQFYRNGGYNQSLIQPE